MNSSTKNLTIYVVYADMEEDIPAAYCLSENDAKALLEGNDIGDYFAVQVSTDVWMELTKLDLFVIPIAIRWSIVIIDTVVTHIVTTYNTMYFATILTRNCNRSYEFFTTTSRTFYAVSAPLSLIL